MSDYSHLVGRIAKLKNWPSGIGVNGSRVSIHSWNTGTTTFNTKLLETQEHVVADLAQLELNTPDEFADRFPGALTVNGSDIAGDDWPTGIVIIDLSDLGMHLHRNPHFTIRGSCRINGKAPGPHSQKNVSQTVHIETASDDDIVEIEWMSFVSNSEGNGTRVLCTRGTVVFRNCQFEGGAVGLVVGTTDSVGKVNVTCETCDFSVSRECGITVNSGHLSTVDCTFQQMGIGICVKEKTFLVAHHCILDSLVGGIVCPNNSSAVVYNCRFQEMKLFGVHVGGASKVHIDRGNFHKCRECVSVVNIDSSICTVAVVRTTMHECQVGVKVGYGSATVKIIRCTLRAVDVGTFVAADALGAVTIKDCDCTLVTHRHVDTSGDHCVVTCDGSVARENQLSRLQSGRRVVGSTPALRVGTQGSTLFRRTAKNAGMIDMTCFNCDSMEGRTEWYSKCAGCKEAYYCSRACQKAHWVRHQPQCSAINLRREFMLSQGYICCVQCRAVESRREEAPYYLDLGSRKWYYCSGECRLKYRSEQHESEV